MIWQSLPFGGAVINTVTTAPDIDTWDCDIDIVCKVKLSLSLMIDIVPLPLTTRSEKLKIKDEGAATIAFIAGV